MMSNSTKFTFQVVASTENAIDQRDLTKWTKLDSNLNVGSDSLELSKKRVLATKNRLRDLDDEMYTRQEKQLARERHAATLKKSFRDAVETDFDSKIKAVTFQLNHNIIYTQECKPTTVFYCVGVKWGFVHMKFKNCSTKKYCLKILL